MTPERILLYKAQAVRAAMGFTNAAKAKSFNISKCHIDAGALPKSAFTKDILRFVRAPDYYTDKAGCLAIMLDELHWLSTNGYLVLKIVDGTRVKSQLCYVITDKLLEA